MPEQTFAEESVATAVAEPASLPAAPAEPAAPDASKPDAEQIDAEEKALYQKLVAEEEASEPPAEASVEDIRAGDENAKKTPEPEAKAKGETTPAEAPPEGAKAKVVDTGEPPEGFDDALDALVRDGMSETAISALFKENPEGFIEYGAKRLKNQKDVDGYGSEYREWLKSHTDGTEPEDAKPDTEAAQPDPAVTDVDKAFAEAIEDIKGDELYGELAEPLEKVLEAVRGQTRSEISALKDELGQRDEAIINLAQANENIRGDMVNRSLEEAREAHLESYPDLKDDEVNERVLKEYDELAESRKYDSVAEAYARAVKTELSAGGNMDEASIAKRVREQLFQRTEQQKAGRPRVPTSAPTPEPETPEDQDKAIFFGLKRKYDGEHSIED